MSPIIFKAEDGKTGKEEFEFIALDEVDPNEFKTEIKNEHEDDYFSIKEIQKHYYEISYQKEQSLSCSSNAFDKSDSSTKEVWVIDTSGINYKGNSLSGPKLTETGTGSFVSYGQRLSGDFVRVVKEEIDIKEEGILVRADSFVTNSKVTGPEESNSLLPEDGSNYEDCVVEESAATSSQNQEYICCDCHKVFELKHEFESHKCRTQGENVNNNFKYKCVVCGECFRLKRDLTLHHTCEHGGRTSASESDLHCGQCSLRFQSVEHLEMHTETFHKTDHSEKFKEVSDVERVSKYKCVCKECGKIFRHYSSLYRHRKIHSGEKCYTCDLCFKSFSRPDHLKLHKLCHTNEKCYSCDVCGKVFTRFHALKAHEQVHTDQVLDVYLEDDLTESDVEEFVCEICGSGFKTKQRLREHIKLHDDARPHVCIICNKSFKQLHNMKEHLLTHNELREFVCEVCNKGFKTKPSLKEHMLVHTKEKKYVCEVCGKRYYKSCHLKQHKVTHTLYTCPVCLESCVGRQALRRHKTQRHCPCGSCDAAPHAGHTSANQSLVKTEFAFVGVEQFEG